MRFMILLKASTESEAGMMPRADPYRDNLTCAKITEYRKEIPWKSKTTYFSPAGARKPVLQEDRQRGGNDAHAFQRQS